MIVKNNILAVDVGSKRVGMALARADVRVPVALKTLNRLSPHFWEQLLKVIDDNGIGRLIVGLPRGLDGQETAQTEEVRAFTEELKTHTSLPLILQDEALTSVNAEAVLGMGKPYNKGDVDALAACFILTDYLETQGVKLQ